MNKKWYNLQIISVALHGLNRLLKNWKLAYNRADKMLKAWAVAADNKFDKCQIALPQKFKKIVRRRSPWLILIANFKPKNIIFFLLKDELLWSLIYLYIGSFLLGLRSIKNLFLQFVRLYFVRL